MAEGELSGTEVLLVECGPMSLTTITTVKIDRKESVRARAASRPLLRAMR